LGTLPYIKQQSYTVGARYRYFLDNSYLVFVVSRSQIFDAYTFVSKLIRKAKASIVLIDNYVDDSVLTMLSKRRKGVAARIYCKRITKQLRLDLEKHNAQYPPIDLVPFDDAHDRFLVLDETVVYHIGASLKDLGKKWFAFSKIEKDALKVVGQLGLGKGD
jgi:hypothetical protein